MAAAILSVNLNKCAHFKGVRCLSSFPHTTSIGQIWLRYHPAQQKGTTISVHGQAEEGKDTMVLDETLTVGDLVGFHIKYLNFECASDQELEEAKKVVEETTKKTVCAFQVLMAKGRGFPEKKKKQRPDAPLTRKDELFNELVDMFQARDLSFPKADAMDKGAYFVQTLELLTNVLCNSLWYITNHQQTINDAAQHRPGLHPVPPCFEFIGYDDRKRKKQKEHQMTAGELNSHAQALYSLLLKPEMKSSPEWVAAHNDIKALADCLLAYKSYLDRQAAIQEHNRNLDHPVRTVDQHTTVEPRQKSFVGVKEAYRLLDDEVKKAGVNVPVFVQESLHLTKQFDSPVQRHRFYSELQLSVPVDIYRFCPGGSIVTTTCLVQARPDRTEPDLLVECARVAMTIKPKFLEYHTRAQKRVFKQKLNNVANVLPSVADLIYKELSLDAAVAAHPDTQERLRLIFLGEKGLLTDLRKLNPGRPSGCFDDFFENLSSIVEEVTIADERRHGIEHLSQWISLNDMINRAVEKCPEGTAIPSKSLVRLQFAPRNPYANTALQFTSKIPVQYKIQRRQLRVSHVDDHYCAAQFRYMREMAIEFRDKCALIFTDDKAKVPVGEPDVPISTGVRGKKTLAPLTSTMTAADHDMSKSSLTPTVILQCDIPDCIDHSFVQGQVTTIVNDSVFQPSSPFRHAVALSKCVTELQKKQDLNILFKFTDGGVDQRNTLESVKCASICLFRECNLDMVIMARCAPGHSYLNPAERVMSLLNLGLQNCALERTESDEEGETLFKKCGSMADLRARAVTNPQVKAKWLPSIEPVQSCIRNRFLRLKLKEIPFQAMDPVREEEIDIFQRHVRELFPNLDLSKLQKVFTSKSREYTDWCERHCRCRQYSFQIRKCEDPACCLPPSIPRDQLIWLPDPVLEENGEHFKSYSEIKGEETTEQDRPSLKKTKPVAAKRALEKDIQQPDPPTVENAPVANTARINAPSSAENASLFTAQHARAVVDCTECNKPRVVYCMQRLSERQKISLLTSVSEYPYSCGGPIFPLEHSLNSKVLTRPNICCAMPVENAYYGGVGQMDICAHCGIPGADRDAELKKQYKTVLPCCEKCLEAGKSCIVYRPFGKRK